MNAMKIEKNILGFFEHSSLWNECHFHFSECFTEWQNEHLSEHSLCENEHSCNRSQFGCKVNF